MDGNAEWIIKPAGDKADWLKDRVRELQKKVHENEVSLAEALKRIEVLEKALASKH